MLISMTGFGQNEISDKNSRISAEIRSVNHRFLDFSIKVPKALSSKEQDIREAVKRKISRGRISVTISINGGGIDQAVKINTVLMERYLKALRRFSRKNGLSGDINVNTIASLPDVFIREEKDSISPRQWGLIRKTIDKALDACTVMRVKEGRALEKDIRKRLAAFEKTLKRIEAMAPEAVESNKKAFRERLEKNLEGTRLDNDRWMAEVSIMADRLDFTEEITRLKSHVAQFNGCLNKDEPVSKKLTYILQEIHREVTTIGSKASSAGIIEKIVVLKEEAEKLREQIQNVE